MSSTPSSTSPPAADTSDPNAGQRPYRSTLRAQQAADTRARIMAAAGDLFTAHGFGATTVALIADRAGVSQPTVYATFGSKAGIVRALTGLLEDQAGAASWRQRIEAEPDPRRKLEEFAAWSTRLYATGRGLIAAIQGASTEPAIGEVHAQGDRNRREWLTGVVAALDRADALRPELTETEALDRAWVLTGFELYFRATDGCGWTDTGYQRWLAALLHEQLCRPDPDDGPDTGSRSSGDGDPS